MTDRDVNAGQRDQAGSDRDRAAERRDLDGDARDAAGERRDEASGERDALGQRRDVDGDQRDVAAAARDSRAERAEDQDHPPSPVERSRAETARVDAASDRQAARRDRYAGASDRSQSELDRTTSHADRQAGARGRTFAETDRHVARADRDSSADDRQDAALDPLTGTYTRGPGLNELAREISKARRTGQPLTVAFIDIDHLKSVNDSRGHGAGDQLIATVAQVIQANLRPYDVIIRYGGDEFLCVINGLGPNLAREVVSRINRALADNPDGGSISVGLAELQAGDTVAVLVGRADEAMYVSRQFERGRSV